MKEAAQKELDELEQSHEALAILCSDVLLLIPDLASKAELTSFDSNKGVSEGTGKEVDAPS